jgi:hypothetical protein
LELVEILLRRIGSANDAEDRGYAEEARAMRSDACSDLRTLLEQDRFLEEILPGLRSSLDTGRILIAGWSSLLDAVERALAEGEAPDCENPGKAFPGT